MVFLHTQSDGGKHLPSEDVKLNSWGKTACVLPHGMNISWKAISGILGILLENNYEGKGRVILFKAL